MHMTTVTARTVMFGEEVEEVEIVVVEEVEIVVLEVVVECPLSASVMKKA